MMPIPLPGPSGTNPRHFTCLVLAIGALAVAFIAESVIRWSGDLRSFSAFAASSEPVSLAVGEATFSIPANFIATRQRHRITPGQHSHFRTLHLELSWPSLAAASMSDDMAGASPLTGSVIRAELESSPERESLRARLDPFYRRLARGGEQTGPDGLKVLSLSARGASRSDQIVYDPSTPNGFIARCMTGKSTTETTCHRAVVLSSGLELRYRFNRSLLPGWRAIDQSVIRKIEEFRTVTKRKKAKRAA